MATEGGTQDTNTSTVTTQGTEGETKVEDQTQQTTTEPSKSGTGPAKTSGSDDKSKGLLADLTKERKLRQQLQQQIGATSGQIEELKRQIQALTDSRTPTDEEAEAAEVRARFEKLYPWAAKLNEQTIEKLLKTAERGDELSETTSHYWETHGRQMLDRVYEKIAAEVGDLSDRQKNVIKAAYREILDTDDEFAERHANGDPALIEEFVKDWLEDWYRTAVRKVAADNDKNRRPVPRGGDRTVNAGAGEKKINFKDDKQVADAMVASFRRHGGAFES